jgi:hypothetical protein
MSHEGANVMALVDSCKNVVYHSQNVKELRGLNVVALSGISPEQWSVDSARRNVSIKIGEVGGSAIVEDHDTW